MRSAAKRSRRKIQREAARGKRQMDPGFSGEEEDMEIVFHPIGPAADPSPPAPWSPPDSPDSSAEIQYGVVLDMVQKLNSGLGLDRDRAMGDLTGLVKRSLDRPLEHLPQQDAFKPGAFKPHPIIRPDLIDSDGNLRATDIGITWEGSETFLHGVKLVGSDVAGQPT